MSDKEVINVIEKYFRHYEKLDFAECEKIWDFNHDPISLKPTELAEPVVTAEGIKEYFELNFLIDLEIWRPTKFRVVDLIRDDVAFVLADMVCRFTIKDGDVQREKFEAGELPWAPGHQVRWAGVSSFVLHKKNGEWKFIHYEDSTPWNLENLG